jgi:hypothetical protein
VAIGFAERPSAKDEDRVGVAASETMDVIVLADGHGGASVAQHVAATLPSLFLAEAGATMGPETFCAIFSRAFVACEASLQSTPGLKVYAFKRHLFHRAESCATRVAVPRRSLLCTKA